MAQKIIIDADPGIGDALAILVAFVLFFGYFVVFETFWSGQTPGKRWLKLRVIQEDGPGAGLTVTSNTNDSARIATFSNINTFITEMNIWSI